ncbi:hypothetical protein F0562_031728 [Nyssa sinensis]|uniref:HMG box domain-containing protein n=1 Tax=Nyssa sinensis TaxID=561372 RepID=A0A5J5AUJ3_9ASTE|nr:hypothetical protein F0562_031728 [Nyssa sinensis]
MKVVKRKGTVKDKKEALKPVDDRKVGKRKAAPKAEKSSKLAKKDVNKPKRPPSAFFVFLEEFRKTYKQEHPNVTAVSAVGKAAGEKWRAMSNSEKAPYEDKAAKRKSDYEKLITAYNKKQENGSDDEEGFDRSKPEVSGENDEDEEVEDDDDEDDD